MLGQMLEAETLFLSTLTSAALAHTIVTQTLYAQTHQAASSAHVPQDFYRCPAPRQAHIAVARQAMQHQARVRRQSVSTSMNVVPMLTTATFKRCARTCQAVSRAPANPVTLGLEQAAAM
jgi:hypothetical protein